MSMMFGGGRPPTHTPVPQPELVKLAESIAAEASGGAITLDRLEALAASAGVPVSHALAGAAAALVSVSGPEPITFELCGGGCQGYGSLECLEALIGLRAGRIAAGEPSFHVRATGCMNGCMQGPVCRVLTPDGTGYVTLASAKRLEAAVAEILGPAEDA